MKQLEAGDLVVQKVPIFQWWVVQGENVTDAGYVTEAGQVATVLDVNFTKEAAMGGYVDAAVGLQVVRSYVSARKWPVAWEVA